MNHQQMWEAYARLENPEKGYSAWFFGAEPDTLAQLILDGIKTATASLHLWYEDGDEPLPAVGDYSVILNSCEEAVCIIRTTKVYTVPFNRVSEEHAFREGEGDCSLSYWRYVHEKFFTEELKDRNMSFRQDIPVVCEEFQKVYP